MRFCELFFAGPSHDTLVSHRCHSHCCRTFFAPMSHRTAGIRTIDIRTLVSSHCWPFRTVGIRTVGFALVSFALLSFALLSYKRQLRKAGKKVSSVEGNEQYIEFFCYRADCSTECLFISSRCCLTWLNPLKLNTYFCSLQWVEKVTAQMMPSSSPVVKFQHGSLFVTSTVCMYDHGTP